MFMFSSLKKKNLPRLVFLKYPEPVLICVIQLQKMCSLWGGGGKQLLSPDVRLGSRMIVSKDPMQNLTHQGLNWKQSISSSMCCILSLSQSIKLARVIAYYLIASRFSHYRIHLSHSTQHIYNFPTRNAIFKQLF